MSDIEQKATFKDAFKIKDFRLLWSAGALAVLGDQVFPIAIAITLLDRGAGASELGWLFAGPMMGIFGETNYLMFGVAVFLSANLLNLFVPGFIRIKTPTKD